MKAIGDAMGTAAGYTSQYGFQLYDTSGTTEDDTYAATGGYGYTIEIGPPDGNFHMPYETGVVAEWTGAERRTPQNRGGLREALLHRRRARPPTRPTTRSCAAPRRPARCCACTRRSRRRRARTARRASSSVLNIGLPRRSA